jgi:curved DNA-binding protein CbpA
METKLNPFEVLGVTKSFTLDELREKYKRLAIQVHPDKGGSEQLFQLVTSCYRKLLKYHQRKEREKDYLQLKKEFDHYVSNDQYYSQPVAEPPVARMPAEQNRRNINPHFEQRYAPETTDPTVVQDLFNRVFEEHKMEDPYSVGYNVEPSSAVREDFSIPKTLKSFNTKSFNKAFDKIPVDKQQRKELQVYRAPQALPLAKNIQYTELGIEKVDDFSGQNETMRKLNYTDYMRAHQTQRLIDPRSVQARPSFKTVDEFRAYQENNSQMTEEQMREYQLSLRMEKERERQRQYIMQMQDRRIQEQHQKINTRLLNSGVEFPRR